MTETAATHLSTRDVLAKVLQARGRSHAWSVETVNALLASGVVIDAATLADDEALMDRVANAEHYAWFDNDGKGDFVCRCGLPWSIGEGCAFMRGARALAAALSESQS